MKKITLLFAAFLCISFLANAQTQFVNTPNASPKALVGQTIGISDVYVSYYRPAVKGRTLWGELVPYGAPWRAGANDNTIIKFTDNVKIEGQELPAGKYGLHMIPGKEEWIVIFSNNHSSWGSYSYSEKEDALRVSVKAIETTDFEEHLSFKFTSLNKDNATCALHWGKLQVPFNIEMDVHNKVLAGMREDLRNKAGWNWQGWHEAANYCLQNDINHEEALQWASRSVFMTPNAQNMVVKAKLVSQVKDSKEAMWKSIGKDLEASACTWKEYNGAATFAMKKKNYEKAEAWSAKAVDMNPTMTAMMTHAQVMAAKGDEKAAKAIKTKALAKGSNAELNSYGYQLLFAGKTDEALMVFEANVDKNPEDPNVWDSLGEGYYNAGKKEAAIKAFKKSLSLNPPANVKANSLKLLGQLGVEHEDIKP